MLVVPRDRLPEEAHERHAALRGYFCDKDAVATPVEDGWALELNWSNDADRHVDPNLDIGLNWWSSGFERRSMPLARRRHGRVLTCLYDTVTLYSWSAWLAKRNGVVPEGLVILHVDDHRDLGAPRLLLRETNFTDSLTGELISMADPDSVARAIESGAIGMGSFLTPFLHIAPAADVRHLCQPPKVRNTSDFTFTPTAEPDTLLHKGGQRPSIRLVQRHGGAGVGAYRITNQVSDWLADIGDGPILLHIDMDYFNNRYDGDSNWRARENILDPSIDEIRKKIDELGGALNHVTGRIEDCVVAYSPGFFPAELWSEANARLLAAMPGLYAN